VGSRIGPALDIATPNGVGDHEIDTTSSRGRWPDQLKPLKLSAKRPFSGSENGLNGPFEARKRWLGMNWTGVIAASARATCDHDGPGRG